MEDAVQPDTTNEFLEALARLKTRTKDNEYRERVGRMIEKIISGNGEGKLLVDMFSGLAKIKGFNGAVELIDTIEKQEDEIDGSAG